MHQNSAAIQKGAVIQNCAVTQTRALLQNCAAIQNSAVILSAAKDLRLLLPLLSANHPMNLDQPRTIRALQLQEELGFPYVL
jgi:hypothetical protein